MPESAVDKDEEFIEHLAEAEVEIEGDTAYMNGAGTDMAFVLADGHWLLTTPKKRRPGKKGKTKSKNGKKKNSKNAKRIEKKKSAGKLLRRH